MAMPIQLPTYTVDDVRAFPDDGCRYELVNGMLLVTPQPTKAHQVVASRLVAAILAYVGPRGPGIAVSPGEVEVRPSVHLEPDLLVFPSRFGPGVDWANTSDWWLAVEVSGPSFRRYDRDYKRDAYLGLGVREVWLVDLEERCVMVSRAGAPRDRRCCEQLTWHPPEMPEPLLIDLAQLFDGVP